MAVYHFTYHAYRSWRPDHPKGYVRKGEGYLAPDPVMARYYERDAKHPAVTFDRALQRILVEATRSTCGVKSWRLHIVQTCPTHVHIVVSWREFVEWKAVSNSLKRRLGASLSKSLNCKGPWFSRESSRKRVRDLAHLNHLMFDYLPLRHNGERWSECQ